MARLGHSTQRLSMELYSHVSDDLDRRIAKQLNATFQSVSDTSSDWNPNDRGHRPAPATPEHRRS